MAGWRPQESRGHTVSASLGCVATTPPRAGTATGQLAVRFPVLGEIIISHRPSGPEDRVCVLPDPCPVLQARRRPESWPDVLGSPTPGEGQPSTWLRSRGVRSGDPSLQGVLADVTSLRKPMPPSPARHRQLAPLSISLIRRPWKTASRSTQSFVLLPQVPKAHSYLLCHLDPRSSEETQGGKRSAVEPAQSSLLPLSYWWRIPSS